jgi:hypothetical protein
VARLGPQRLGEQLLYSSRRGRLGEISRFFGVLSGTLSLFSTTTVFGAPRDVTVSELAIETFYPADTATGTVLRSLMPDRPAD